MSDPKPRFTGIFIPVEILLHQDLSPLDQILLSWIDALYDEEKGGCYASNAYLSEKLKVKENTIAKAKTHLRKLKLLEDVEFNGRRQVVRAMIGHFVDKRQDKKKLHKNKPNPKQHWIKIQGSIGEKSKAASNAHSITNRKEDRKEQQQKEETDPPRKPKDVVVVVPSFLIEIESLSEKLALSLMKQFTLQQLQSAAARLKESKTHVNNPYGWLKACIVDTYPATETKADKTAANQKVIQDCFTSLDGKIIGGRRIDVTPSCISFSCGGISNITHSIQCSEPNFESKVRKYIEVLREHGLQNTNQQLLRYLQ